MEEKMSSQRAADLLVKCLLKQGVSNIFGVPGESYLSVLDALLDHQDDIKFISARHEGGASFMAEAYGKLMGQAGVCFVTRGPGATNASIGVHTAMQNSTPMVLFIGQIGRAMTDREAFQEVDYRMFFGPIAKWVTQIDAPDRIPELIARAFATACSGRPGPVVVALPEDMLRELTDAKPADSSPALSAQVSEAPLQTISRELQSANRPLIISGGGGWTDQGRDDLQRFAEQAKIPVICGFRNQDLIETTSDAYVGDASFGKPETLKQLIANSDCILAINIRFGEVVTDGWDMFDFPHPKQKIIHTHISEAEINKVYQCSIGVVASPDSVVSGLSMMDIKGDWDDYYSAARSDFLETRTVPDTLGALNVAKICNYLNENSDADAIYTNGAGNYAIWPGKYLNYSKKHRLLAPQSGAMGAGIPAAIAAKVAFPDRQVICFSGDGDFQMSSGELGTAMQQMLDPIILIHNNGSYGTIRMHQEMRYPNRVSGTELVNPNFASLAEAYGFGYARIENDADFPAAFQMAKSAAFGFIIEMIADPRDIAPHKTI
jgi:acetolactate synthase-1/2/3 large subunit